MKRKELRVKKILNEMNAVVPWAALTETIKPHYKNYGGRPPHDLELMLRIHFLQLWNNLSDPSMEEALYDRMSFQKFLGFDCFGGDALLHGEEKAIFGDSAYSVKADKAQARAAEIYYGISDRGYRKHPLSPTQKNAIESTLLFVQKPNIRSRLLSICGIIGSCVTKAWLKTPANLSRCVPCRTCIYAEEIWLGQDKCI